MSLPALQKSPPNTDISTTVNRLVREFNRQDRKAPIIGTDTGVTGAAYVIAPVPGVKMYEVGQEFVFKAVNANTGTAPTLAVNGLTAGTITYPDGTPLVVGAIAAGQWVEVIVASVTGGTPTFVINAPRPLLSKITASLGADVSLNNTATYFDGPSLALGLGVWFVIAQATLLDGAGAATFDAKLWDATTVMSSLETNNTAANFVTTVTLAGVITNPAANVRLSVRDKTSTAGVMKFNLSGNSKDCSITAVRIG